MEFASAPPIHEQVRYRPYHADRPCCPVCNGPLLEARSTFRCARCYYSFCAGCEGGEAEGTIDDF
jgi:hypothetical protein